MQTIQEIKSRHDIFSMAQLAGVELRRASTNLYFSPFRAERKPSFSIYDNGRKFKDFATDETGDSITFYALARNIDNKQAIKELAGDAKGFSFIAQNRPTKQPLETTETPKPSLIIPPLTWDTAKAKTLSTQRGFNVEALEIAYKAGVFGFCEYKGLSSWIITDSTKQNAQARRTDGKLYFGKLKAMTLKNSKCSYPLGLSTIGDKKLICIAEGSTDFLALYHFAYIFNVVDDIAPLAILGASQSIKAECLNALAGRHVLIFPDADEAGRHALNKWGEALSQVSKSLRYFDYAGAIMYTGEKVKDLCDFMQLDYDYWEGVRPYNNPFLEALAKINKEKAI